MGKKYLCKHTVRSRYNIDKLTYLKLIEETAKVTNKVS